MVYGIKLPKCLFTTGIFVHVGVFLLRISRLFLHSLLPFALILMESKPLVRTIKNKKVLELPSPVFEDKEVSFKDYPLFSITEHHAKFSIGNIAAMSQVCKGIQDFMSGIITH